jgi:hypothetical protein
MSSYFYRERENIGKGDNKEEMVNRRNKDGLGFSHIKSEVETFRGTSAHS